MTVRRYSAFLSYTRFDDRHDRGLITTLREGLSGEIELKRGYSFSIFQDRYSLGLGEEWDERIVEALEESTFLIAILTPKFFNSDACRGEVRRFLEIEKQRNGHGLIIPIQYVGMPRIWDEEHRDRDDVARVLRGRQIADLTSFRDDAEDIRRQTIQSLADRIIERLDDITEDEGPNRQVQALARTTSGPVILNRPPALVPSKFVDRRNVFENMVARLQVRSRGVTVLRGDTGSGKTAFVAEFVNRLESKALPLELSAFDYISVRGYRLVSAVTIIDDLAKANPDEVARSRLLERLHGQRVRWLDELNDVLTALGNHRVLVVIDNVERLLDARGFVRERMIRDLIHNLADRSDHNVQLLLVTSAPLEQQMPGYSPADALVLDRGLSEEYFRDLAKVLDPHDTSRILASAERFRDLHELTDGLPRSLELTCSLLDGRPSDALPELLEAMRRTPVGARPTLLLNRAMAELRPHEVSVVRAVAIFGRPVPAEAVNGLLGHDRTPDLERLCDRHLVRQDGNRYYLPPNEAEHVVRQTERGMAVDRRNSPMPQTQIALLHHAANYFAREAAGTVVRRVDDLSPHFGEIDLRVKGEEFDRAFDLIMNVDMDHLVGSGHSDTLSEYREQVVGRLGNAHDEVRNLSELANAKRQQERPDDALEALRRAQEHNARVPDPRTRVDTDRQLLLMIAGVRFHDGRVTLARDVYEKALHLRPMEPNPLGEAQAHSGLLCCLTEIGRFKEASRHLKRSLALVQDDTSDDTSNASARLHAELLLNGGVLHLYNGKSHVAADWLERARSRARAIGNPLLAVKCIDALAFAALDQGDTRRALELATRAAEEGARSGSPEISRMTNTTLALIHLRNGRTADALAAASAAAEFGQSSRRWSVLGVRGIAFLRARDPERARDCFMAAHVDAMAMLDKEKNNYQVLEADGLALTGLTLCGPNDHLPAADNAYRRARKRTSADGATRLCLLRLNALLAESNNAAYDGVRAAASGL